MSRIRTLIAATAVAVTSSTALMGSGVALADPIVPPLPLPASGLPGLPAIEQLSPVIQQAAADPAGAASLLMAAAAAFTGSSTTPAVSREVADSVSQFVQTPTGAGAPADAAVHLPTPGSEPGGVAHLPSGIDPANAVGPAAAAAHVPTPGSAPDAPAHLPSGVDPANAVGPAAEAAPFAEVAAPVAESAPVPEAAAFPAAAPEAAAFVAPPAPEAATPVTPGADAGGPAPGATAAFSPDSPPTQDFMYPSIGSGCLPDGGNSIATALSVAGPATIPTPGPAPGQTAYVFTAVGTSGPAETQKLPLNVTWVNLTTGKSGTVTLQPHPDINPEGPTTLTAIADTGSGSIMSTIFGQVSTKDAQCNFIPTIGSTVVP